MSKKKTKLEEITVQPTAPPITEIVDKTGIVGIEYGRIPTGRAFKIPDSNDPDSIYVMTDRDFDTTRLAINIQTGHAFAFSDETRCLLLKLKIYVTKTLCE